MSAIGHLCRAAALVIGLSAPAAAAAGDRPLPRFTEEREAAALHLAKEHCPELMPLLEELRNNHRAQYEQEVREIFEVTETLTELMDNPRRYDLELKIWKTENKAYVMVGKLATPKEDDRKKIEAQLLDLAR